MYVIKISTEEDLEKIGEKVGMNLGEITRLIALKRGLNAQSASENPILSSDKLNSGFTINISNSVLAIVTKLQVEKMNTMQQPYAN